MMAVLRNLFLVARPTTLEHVPAFRSFLPEARDELMRTFSLDASSLATAFPFISNSLFMPTGVLVGITPNGEPVVIDEWDESLDNPHEFCGAITGAGKSYLYKIRIMRELLQHRTQGLQVVVIDPEKEYEDLCLALGGDYVRLAPGSDQHLNPFDLLPQGTNIDAYVPTKGRRCTRSSTSCCQIADQAASPRSQHGRKASWIGPSMKPTVRSASPRIPAPTTARCRSCVTYMT